MWRVVVPGTSQLLPMIALRRSVPSRQVLLSHEALLVALPVETGSRDRGSQGVSRDAVQLGDF